MCDGATDLSGIRSEVVESWLRSRENGVSPHLDSAPKSLVQASGLDDDLLRAASDVATMLKRALSRDTALISVSNRNGDILLVSGESRAVASGAEINVRPGFSWNEAKAGTNVLGTGTVLGKSIQIDGPEHYVGAWHSWFCCSAPILHSAARMVVGSLAIAGFQEPVHPRALDIAVEASNLIGKVLYGVQAMERVALERAFQAMSQRYRDAALISLDPYQIVTDVATTSSIPLKRLRDAVGSCLLGLPGFERFAAFEFSNQPQELGVSIENATDVIAHPVFNGERFAGTILLCMTSGSSAKQKIRPEAQAENSGPSKHTFSEIVGTSETIRKAVVLALKAASTNYPVLLLGESGTGKELFAHAIHGLSPRRNGPFIAFNCGAVSEELVTSELFGHEPGAFTGSSRRTKAGLFDAANGGTLFLDELQDSGPKVQSHLLRFLETGAFMRVGGTTPVRSNVRVITASNADRPELTQKVRSDLLYRVNCITVGIPPLRQRKEDIRPIGERFLRQVLNFTGTVAEEVWQKLCEYDWPGNVRELQNVLVRSTLNSGGSRLTVDDLSGCFEQSAGPNCTEIEEDLLSRALEESQGNVSEAARRLGIHRSTLYRRFGRRTSRRL